MPNNKSDKSVESPAKTKRSPTQERSKDRLQRILMAAEQCILKRGGADLKISNIAQEADMPHASIYQYFANREEIIEAMLRRYLADFNQSTLDLLDSVNTVNEFISFFETSIYAFHDFVKSNPAYQEIWWQAKGSEKLQAMDADDNVLIAEATLKKATTIFPNSDHKKLYSMFLMGIETAASITRSAVKIGGKTERDMMDEMTQMIIAHLQRRLLSEA